MLEKIKDLESVVPVIYFRFMPCPSDRLKEKNGGFNAFKKHMGKKCGEKAFILLTN